MDISVQNPKLDTSVHNHKSDTSVLNNKSGTSVQNHKSDSSWTPMSNIKSQILVSEINNLVKKCLSNVLYFSYIFLFIIFNEINYRLPIT